MFTKRSQSTEVQLPLRQNSIIQQRDFHAVKQVTYYGQSVKTPQNRDLTLTGSADAQVSQIGSKISGTIGATQGWECGFLRI